MENAQELLKLYEKRFSRYERVRKLKLWQVLVRDFLQQFVKPSDTVVDIGAGSCEFINTITAGKKIALDINLEVKQHAQKGVKVILKPLQQIRQIFKTGEVDVFFMSNLLEHLNSKREVFKVLLDTYRLLPPEGKILIMQPDISRIGHSYWDFFDHKTPITKSSLLEALVTVGFRIYYLKAPFLPYSVKYRYYPLSPTLLKWYIKLRPLHYFFGKQFFVCAVKP